MPTVQIRVEMLNLKYIEQLISPPNRSMSLIYFWSKFFDCDCVYLLSPLKWTHVTLLMWPFNSFLTDVFPGLNATISKTIIKSTNYKIVLLWARLTEACVVPDLLLLVPQALHQRCQLLSQPMSFFINWWHAWSVLCSSLDILTSKREEKKTT